MNVLSLFDGMSCGQLALDRAGVKVDKYLASEIDNHAIQVTMRNYPKTVQLGSIIDLTTEQLLALGNIHIVIGGSPCQGFSVAGHMKGSTTKEGVDVVSLEQYLELKELGFEFEGQSYLFWEYVRVLKIVKPTYFFLENVRVTKKWLPMFNEAMGTDPIMINSSLVSAQKRTRYYWTNIPNITQPKDRKITLKDILENDLEIDRSGLKIITNINPSGKGMNGNIHSTGREKSPALTTNKGEGMKIGYFGGAIRGRYDENKKIIQKIECNKTKKSNSLTTVQKDNILIIDGKERVVEATKKGYVEAEIGEGLDLTFPASKTRRGRLMKDKSNCLTAANYEYGIIGKDLIWRKFTPIECERLQTVPDNYTDCVSNSQRYKMLGNGWTIDVIAHILKNIK